MLAKAPEHRPQTPLAVAEQLAGFASGAKLSELARRAGTLSPSQTILAGSTTSPRSTPRRQPLLRRPVPLLVAIAAGLFGLVIGLFGGLLITIKYPDGTTAQISAPLGSDVEMKYVAEEPAPEHSAAAPPKQDDADAPLQFAVLVEGFTMLDPDSVNAAKAALAKSVDDEPVRIEGGIWFPIAADVQVPIEATHHGTRYALVTTHESGWVPWSEVQGHIRSAQSQFGRLELQFDDFLANRMRTLSGQNLNRQLAVIINKKIDSAPYIRSEIGGRTAISGNFSGADMRFLMDSITGGLVAPMMGSEELAQTRGEAIAAKNAAETRFNLKRIGLGFHFFHDDYKKLPGSANQLTGARLETKDGKVYPFSWRVAILPFIEENELFQQYRFDEPWDSEANLKLLEKMPSIYRSPLAPADQAVGNTNYQGFATEGGALGKGDGYAFSDFTDGTSNTLLIIETKDSVPWTKPQDIEGEPDFFAGGPINYVMVDGSVRSMQSLDRDQLAGLVTRNGGEPAQP